MKKIVLLLFLLATYSTFSQSIIFFPKVVYVDPNKRTGEIIVSNTGFSNVEVEMSYKFGFPVYDSLGNIKMTYTDSSLIAYSLDPYIKIFPKKFVLGGQKRQMVRFIINHPGNIPDGTYFTRVIASAKKAQKNIDSSNFKKKDTLSMQYAIVTNLQTAIFYEKGQVDAGITINKANHEIDSSNLFLVLGIDKTGNTPFWGNYYLEIYDKNTNSLIEESNGPLPVYLNTDKKIKLSKEKYNSGNYLAKIRIDNKREEIPKQLLPKFDEIQKTYEFSLP